MFQKLLYIQERWNSSTLGIFKCKGGSELSRWCLWIWIQRIL